MRICRAAAAALVAALLATGCSSEPEPEPEPTETPTETPTPSETPTEEPEAFPLTGEDTDDPLLDQPVLAVKIENTPSARPLAGIDRADVVYEEIVEGGVTRFAALFHSELLPEVGPVRSGRLVDVPLLEPWFPIMVYSGARPDVTDALAGADHIGLLPDPGTGPVFSRAPDRPGSHDLMADLTLAVERLDDLDDAEAVPEATGLAFADEVPDGGRDDEAFEIRMTTASRAGWEWDGEAELFRRLQNGEPLPVTGEDRIGAANVVAILTDIGTGGCCDTAGNPFTVTRLDGEGEALAWRDGQRFTVTWRKDGVAGPLELLDQAGEPFAFRPGPTWYHLTSPGAVPELPEASETASPTGTATE